MERNEEEGERAARPYVRSVSGNPKEKEKKTYSRRIVSVWFDGANTKNPGIRDGVFFFFFFLLTGQKAFYRPQQDNGRIVVCSTPNWRFVRSISKTLRRLHLIVLVDLIMFTHANRLQITLTCFFFFLPHPPRSTFAVPIFDISVSCMLQCHHWRYRYVYARQRGVRHHAAVPHGRRHILVLPMHLDERPH